MRRSSAGSSWPGLRAELGYADDERVCIVTVGGSGVGADLLRRVIAAFPAAKEGVPDLRTIVVAGRIAELL
jgi:predicted glycosyltransferase